MESQDSFVRCPQPWNKLRLYDIKASYWSPCLRQKWDEKVRNKDIKINENETFPRNNSISKI